jgi:hypothetical protein
VKKHDDYTDAVAYLKERVASEEYRKALMERHPLMNSAINQAAMSSGLWSPNTGASMGAVNQAWPSATGASITKSSYPYEPDSTTRQFAVEKVDNGFIIRSGKYSKICKDMEELSNQFIAIMVEAQLDK